MRLPPLAPVRSVVAALRARGLVVALGGSGLLAAYGLVDVVGDWDLTTDADTEAVATALDATGLPVRSHPAEDSGVFATRARFAVGQDGIVEVLVGFALRDEAGVAIALPAHVTRHWRGLPVGDPAVWRRAYELLGRPERAALLTGASVS